MKRVLQWAGIGLLALAFVLLNVRMFASLASDAKAMVLGLWLSLLTVVLVVTLYLTRNPNP